MNEKNLEDKIKVSKGIGINRQGGKFRLAKKILPYIPYYDFFASLFVGAGWVELSLPRANNYELWNDIDSELINYWYVMKTKFNEFNKRLDEIEIFYLNSEYIYEKINNGELKPKDDVERAIHFRYMNKLTRAGTKKKEKDYYRGSTSKRTLSTYKGTQGKTTRPFTNNDCGLLSPIDEKSIDRMKYVILRELPFKKAYESFIKVLKKYDIVDTVFVYGDPPYYLQEINYEFPEDDVNDLINILKTTPYKMALSINNHPRYRDEFENNDKFKIVELTTRYSTNVNAQNEITELLIMNYDINNCRRMINKTTDNENRFF